MNMPENESRAGAREWIGLAVLALPTMLLAVDMSVLFLALPHLGADLHASSTQQLWITDVYGFMVAGFLVTMGTVGDRIGHKRLCLIGAGCFAVVSAVAAFAPSATVLILARGLLGVAGATLLPSTMTLIRNMFHNPKQLGIAIAIWGTGFTAGAAVGPAVGGALLNSFWWGSVFLMAVPIMAIVLIVGPMVLPEFRNPQANRLDPLSILLSLLAILPVIYGLTEGVKFGWGVGTIAAVVFGVIMGVVFVLRQNKLTNPLLDLKLFGNRLLRAALIVSLLTAVFQSGTGYMVSTYMQIVQGKSPLVAGLWLVPPAVALMISINLTPHLVQRIKPVYLIASGMGIAIVGQVVLSQVQATSSPVHAMIALALIYFGVGPVAAQIPNLIMTSAPQERAGSAAAIMQTTGEFGLALGIAVLGAVAAVGYSLHVSPVPGVSAADSASIRENLPNAVQVAHELPGQTGAAVLANAREAFTFSVSTVAWICAGLFLLLAILTLTVLNRGAQPAAAPPREEAVEAPGAADSNVG